MDDLKRLRTEYGRRKADPQLAGRYSVFNEAQLFIIQSRERILLRLLKKHGLHGFAAYRILDVGCGSGFEMMNLLRYGTQPEHLFGIDLLPERIRQAYEHHWRSGLAQADGRFLPFPNASFDLAFQFTVFTSILDIAVKQALAADILRVLKPGGYLIWYDFWADNPANAHVKGIKPAEIRRLFPGCTFDFCRVTLAPPIARRIVPISWLAAELLNLIPWLLTHYFVIIRKQH
jgi:ubiquinone/menaquinone biosynthesis C-methylase UbiE